MAPYEEPENPEIVVDTEQYDVDACVDLLEDYVTKQFVDPVHAFSTDKKLS